MGAATGEGRGMSRKLTCAEREKILHADGRYAGWSVESGFTDMDGEYGDPRMETTWERGGRRIRDVRHPGRNGEKDPRPCEHYELDEIGVDDD